MAAASGQSTAAVAADVAARPGAWDFFQAVRTAEARAAHGAIARPVGFDHAPAREAVHMRAVPSLAFSPGAVRDVQAGSASVDDESANGAPPDLRIAFLGLVGPTGVLPQHYTELEIRRLYLRDSSLRDFLDVFHHRAASFFYRAWRKYRLPFGHEHAARWGVQRDPFELALAALVGRGTQPLSRLKKVSDRAWVYFAGQFARSNRSAAGLQSMLGGYLDLPVRVHQFVGRWLELGPSDRSRMPSRAQPLGQNNALGRGLVLGNRVWDVQSKMRVEIGPMTLREFSELRPDGREFARLVELVRGYVDHAIDFDFELVLARGEARPAQLERASEPRLGWNTWLASRDAGSMSSRIRLGTTSVA
jgi:type VI secretion system protein ImpH